MILILSKKEGDFTTEVVIDWLYHSDKECFIRVNSESFLESLVFSLSSNCSEVITNNQFLDFNKINVIWYRRWSNGVEFELLLNQESTNFTLNNFIKREFNSLSSSFFSVFKNKKWLSKPNINKLLNKYDVLAEAKKVGLNVPNTIITNSKSQLQSFHKKNINLITKPIGEVSQYEYKQKNHLQYTRIINKNEINTFPDFFFPSLFQKQILKDFEIRTFYLEGLFYSMAIFSQNDDKTSVDFRRYNIAKPNRNIPFKLPKSIEKKLKCLLDIYAFDTASIDIIKGLDGEYYFLEINPVGQFGMVSIPCNYYLESKVADYLIKQNYVS